MEEDFDNFTDDKVCVYETVISEGFINGELYDTDNKQRNIHNCVTIKDKNMDDGRVVDFTNETPYDIKYKQGNINNYVHIKDENIDDLTVIIQETEVLTDCKDDKVCLNETVISGRYTQQEPCTMKDEQENIQNDMSIKDETIDDPTVVTQETELPTNCIDSKVCVYETVISRGCIKEEPCNMENKSGSIHNINIKVCEECGEDYNLYCLRCPMLTRIFDSSNPNGRNDTVRRTLPKNFIDFRYTPSYLAVVALRIIPEGVVLGPFKGLVSTQDGKVSKWKLKNKKLVCTKDSGWSNWMQHIRIADQGSHQNLASFQYEGRLYYRSECHINVGDELLVRWDSDSKKGEIQDMSDSYWEPRVCESLDYSYACTFCCVGYKSISHLKAHNSTCIEKKNEKQFCRDIIQCDICRIYLDKKEYSDYHMDRYDESNEECVLNSRYRRNRNAVFSCTLCPYKATTKSDLRQHIAIHNGDKPFACSLCPYKTTIKSNMKRHIDVHENDKPFACTFCPYKGKRKSDLKEHMAIHNDGKPFACTLCPYKAKRKSDLRDHMAIHNDGKPFACTLCSYRAKRKSNLKFHLTSHNNDRPFACTLCPYRAMTKGRLNQHIQIHSDDKPFACTLCPYKAKTKPHLQQHIVTHSDDRPFACPHCTYKATTKSFLKKHVAIHNEKKSFACTLCPYEAVTKSSLNQHALVHKVGKQFACALCPYKATTKWFLKKHIAIHIDDKSFACTQCSYKTTTESRLKQHITIHDEGKPFACALCPYKTTAKSLLERHVTNHNGDGPFAYKAKNNMMLKRHLVSHNE